MACLAALGEIPPLDVAVHADTTHERAATYAFAAEHTAWLEAHGVSVVTVRAADTDSLDEPAWFTQHEDGSKGQVRRQCTSHWKVHPIRQWLNAHRNGQRVEQLFGISLDEIQRMRDPDVLYIDHSYPLVDKRMTRGDCVLWLQAHGLDVPKRSACVFCPFQSGREWSSLAVSDREHAIDIDRQIRTILPPHPLYAHVSLRPLSEVDLRSETERGQLDLWDSLCDGHCGL